MQLTFKSQSFLHVGTMPLSWQTEIARILPPGGMSCVFYSGKG